MRSRIKKSKQLISMLTFCLLLGACLEQEQGCLNPNALNFDVNADENTGCSFPNLRLSVAHHWGTEIFRLNTAYELTSGDSVSFNTLKFYVSDAVLGGNQALTVFDSVLLNDGNFQKDDLTILSPTLFSFVLGSINEFGSFDEIQFDVGFGQRWNSVDTTFIRDLESTHPWFDNDLKLEDNNRMICKIGYSYFKADTVDRNFGAIGPIEIRIEEIGSFNVTQANHGTVNLLLDYKILFDNLDLRHGEEDILKNSILSRMPEAFSIDQ